MKTVIALLALVLGVLTAAGAHAQTCRERQVPTRNLTAKTVMLFNMDRKYQGLVSVAELGARLDIADCGDPTYVMWDRGGETYLLMKTQVFPSTQPPPPCTCMPTGQASTPYGAPGASDRFFCTATEPKCLKR